MAGLEGLVQGEDVSASLIGSAAAIAADLVGITDYFVGRLYDLGGLMVTQYDALAPVFYNTVNYPLFDIAFGGSFVSGLMGRPKGALLSGGIAAGLTLGKAALDYGAGYYVGTLGSVFAASILATAGYVGLGLAAGYILRSLFKGIKSLVKRG